MKKTNIILALSLTLAISLTGCGSDTTNDVKASDKITSSQNVSSDVVDSEASSALSSSQPISSKPVSSKPASSKTTSSSLASSKPTLSKPASSKPASSKPASSKLASSKPASSKPASSMPASSEPASSTPTNSVSQETDQFSASTIEQILFVLVNEERASLGLSQLRWNNTLYMSAKIRSDEIAAEDLDLGISHTRPNGTSWSTTLKEVNYSEYYAYAGENLAAVQQRMNSTNIYGNEKLAEVTFNGWKNSKGHYEAITRPETIEIGIAVTRNANDVYATQHFGQIE